MESPEVATGPDPQPRAYCVPRTVRRLGCLRTPSARVGAVLRSGQGGDGRRSGASFGARAGAVGATHSTGCRARSACPSGGARGLPCLLLLLRPERHFSNAVLRIAGAKWGVIA